MASVIQRLARRFQVLSIQVCEEIGEANEALELFCNELAKSTKVGRIHVHAKRVHASVVRESAQLHGHGVDERRPSVVHDVKQPSRIRMLCLGQIETNSGVCLMVGRHT